MSKRSVSMCFLVMTVSSSAIAGNLNPPAGPMLPTMKDLDDVEPRTAINAVNTPSDADSVFKITQPGSYYLTGNIVGPSGFNGIEVVSSDVVIDLMGFSLIGAAGSLNGIHMSLGDQKNIVIRNGTIRDWDGDGINLGAFNLGFLIENISMQLIGNDGIVASFSGVIRNCAINNCTGNGISVDCCVLIQGCQIGQTSAFGVTAGQNATVLDCVFNNCTGGGVNMSRDGIVARSTIAFSKNNGIQVGARCYVFDNYVDASATGISATSTGNRIEANHCTSNSTGLSVTGTGNLVVRNFATQNTIQYTVVAGNLFGPIVTTANILSNNSPHANYRH